MKTDQREFTANVHEEDDGSYWAEVSELPGVSRQVTISTS